MKRKPILLAAAAVALPSLMGVAALRGTSRPALPVHVVERGPFRNEVLAYGVLQAVRSTPISVPPDLQRPMRVAWLAPAGPVKQGDPVVEFDPTEITKQYEDGRSDSASATQKGKKAEVEGRQSGTSLGIDRGVAEEELRRAEDVAPTDAQIFSRNQILESSIDRGLLKKRVETADAKKTPAARLAQTDVALAEIERRKAEMRVSQAEQSLRALKVKAPHDGILVYPLSFRGDAVAVGDTVWPSQTIAELPDLASLEAHVFVLEGDASGLAAGQAARVEVEGQPGLARESKITRVDALAKSRERGSPVKYFETVLGLEGGTAVLKPGQRVRARILVDDLKEAIAIPRGALVERDGRRFVYRFEGGRFREVEVQVARRSVGRVVVTSGLKPGEEIALRDPEKRAGSGAAASGSGAPGPVTSR